MEYEYTYIFNVKKNNIMVLISYNMITNYIIFRFVKTEIIRTLLYFIENSLSNVIKQLNFGCEVEVYNWIT